MIALTRMRIQAYARSQRAYAPLAAALVLVLVAHAGGPSEPNQAYAFSAALLFVVFAWQTKLVLDTEPDTQRLLSRLAVGSARAEIGAGLLAAALGALPILALALVVPILGGFIGVSTSGLLPWLGFGLWIHVVSGLGGLAIGALASRAVVRARGVGAALLVGAFVLVLVLGSRGPVVPRWLVPQLVGAADVGGVAYGALVTLHALAWSALGCLVYVGLRRGRP